MLHWYLFAVSWMGRKGAKVIRNGYKLLWRSGSKAENGVGDEWKLLLGMRSGKLSCAIITHRLGGEPWKRRNYMKLLIGLWPGKKFLLVVTSIVILEGRLVALVKFMEVMWLASGMCVCVCVCVCVWFGSWERYMTDEYLFPEKKWDIL